MNIEQGKEEGNRTSAVTCMVWHADRAEQISGIGADGGARHDLAAQAYKELVFGGYTDH
jgi:hypothetical protein